MKRTIAALAFVIFFLSAPLARASVMFALSSPEVVDKEISFTATLADVSTQSCPTGKCYFQGMITKKDKNEYFGFTKNNVGELKAYVSSPNAQFVKENFLYCEPVEGKCELAVKMNFNHDDPKYAGPGEYSVKMKRYTGESETGSGTFATNELNISLSVATPAPSPTPSPTPTSTPSPTPSASPTISATPSPSPAERVSASMGAPKSSPPTPTPHSIATPSIKPNDEPINQLGQATSPPKILGTMDESASTEKSISTPALILIVSGVGAMAIAGVSFWREKYNNKGLHE